jgi:hypothetical protein
VVKVRFEISRSLCHERGIATAFDVNVMDVKERQKVTNTQTIIDAVEWLNIMVGRMIFRPVCRYVWFEFAARASRRRFD